MLVRSVNADTTTSFAMRKRDAETQYLVYAKIAKPFTTDNALVHMAAAAVSHPDLNLMRLTPEYLKRPLIDILMQWKSSGLCVNTQHALDRLHGLYGTCSRCGEYRIMEIGGIYHLDGDDFKLNSPHICQECRESIDR